MDWCDILGWTEEQLQDLRATGYSYVVQGLYARAAVFFEALVAINPKSTYDIQTLGAIYLQTGQIDLALSHLEKALDLQPTHLSTLLNKTKALLISGKLAEGLALAQSLTRAPNSHVRNLAEALIMAYQ